MYTKKLLHRDASIIGFESNLYLHDWHKMLVDRLSDEMGREREKKRLFFQQRGLRISLESFNYLKTNKPSCFGQAGRKSRDRRRDDLWNSLIFEKEKDPLYSRELCSRNFKDLLNKLHLELSLFFFLKKLIFQIPCFRFLVPSVHVL